MNCSNAHTFKAKKVWALGDNAALGVVTDLAGNVSWRTKCLDCGVLSDPIPLKVAMKWGPPTFDISLTSRTVLGVEREILPEGWFTCAITSSEPVAVKSGKNEGKPMYKITCTITEGPHAGRALLKWVCLFEPAWFSYKQIAKSLGWEIEYNDKKEPIPCTAKDLLNQKLSMRVVHEPSFQDSSQMAATIKSFARVGADVENKGKIRIRI